VGRSAVAVIALFTIVVAIFTAGAYMGARNPEGLPGPIRDRVIDPEGIGAINEAFGLIQDLYREAPKDRKLVDDAIGGMVDGLDDRFSTYLDPKEYARFNEAQDNRFEGIGVVVRQDPKGLLITEVYKGSPAKEAGLRADDLIVQADEHELKGLTADQASRHVRGPANTKVRLVIERPDGKATRRLRITSGRDRVEVPIVDSRLERKGGTPVGIVRLAQFTNDAALNVARELQKMKKRGAKRFVLDLRSNPGGLVTEAQALASLFLKGGTVVTLRGRTVGEQTFPAGDDPIFPDEPLVVLVDRGSASAAEIVTGALQDRDRATVVGTNTYGKGVFQRVVPLSSGGAVDITAGQYFTPKNRNLGGKGSDRGTGLAPDVRAKDDPKTTDRNEALDRAVTEARKLKDPR